MLAAVYHNNRDIRVERVPVPNIGPGEMLVKIKASGICGSDVMEWYRIKKAPLVLGHEIAGLVEQIGSGTIKYKPGDRVFVTHHVPCNTCSFCLSGSHSACDTLHSTNFDPGGFSEYVRVPALQTDRGTLLLPDQISFEQGSFIEPLACVIRAQRLAGIRPPQTLVVLGSGISGILHIALAKACGIGRIIATDINPYRLEAASKFGATAAVHADEDIPALVRKLNRGNLADVVMVCASSPSTFNQALQSVERGGCIMLFAPFTPGQELKFSANDFWNQGIRLTSTYAGAPIDCVEALGFLANKQIPVEEMITHRLTLEETQKGFELVTQGSESLKVLVIP